MSDEIISLANSLVGEQFGKLTALGVVGRHQKKRCRVWICECECGSRVYVAESDLKNGSVTDCGCEERSESNGLYTDLKHGVSKAHAAWVNAKQKCYNKNNPDYRFYGGLGVRFCPEWRYDFQAFLDAVGPAPGPKYMLIRFDSTKDYEPGNVGWTDDVMHRRHKPMADRYTEGNYAAIR